jgi:T5SS/PEP-CTERM-associated repeat protein
MRVSVVRPVLRRFSALGRTLAAVVVALPVAALADVTSVDTRGTLRALSVFEGGGEDITLPIPDGFEDLHESVTANATENKGRGTATLDVEISRSTDGLTVSARGTTDIESPGTLDGLDFTGSGGAVGLNVFFCLDERASFVVSSTLQVQTNGDTESTDATFDFDGTDPEIELVAEDASDRPRNASIGRSGILDPGCYSLDGTTNSSLGDTQSASRSSFTFSLTLATSENDDGNVFRWIGPSVGVFAQENNWDPTGVPAFEEGVRSDTALFQGLGSVDVDITTLAAATLPPAKDRELAPIVLAPTCTGPITRTIGRVRLDAARDLELVNGTLALNALSIAEPSLTIENNGLLELRDAGLCARNAQLGGGRKPSLAIVSGPGGKLQTLARLSIGGSGRGTGTLQVRDAGIAASEEVRIGNGSAVGKATVTDATWTTGNLAVGFSGTADLVVENAGLLQTNGQAFVDFEIPSQTVVKPPKDDTSLCIGRLNSGNVLVRGTSSRWNAETLSLGGRACVEVAAGGRIVLTAGTTGAGEALVGTRGTDQATVFVSAGGNVDAAQMRIGDGALGRVVVVEGFQNNGLLDVDGPLSVGGGGGAGNGLLRIVGDPSTDDPSVVAENLFVPDTATSRGAVEIEFGGRMQTSNTAEIGGEGFGVVELKGAALGAPDQLTVWQIGNHLRIGPRGIVILGDAAINVGSASTTGSVTIEPGGQLIATGSQINLVRTNGGLITNNGTIIGPATLDGVYDPQSTGRIVQQFGASPPAPAAAAVAEMAASEGRAKKPVPTVPQGPVVFTTDPDLGATTLVLQFLNGFAPGAGAALSALALPAALVDDPAVVEIQGLAPGATFTPSAANGLVAFTATAATTALPVVSVTGKATIKEKAKLALKVARVGGDTIQPLVVSYAIGGSATNGIDYAPLSGTITLAAKKKSAKLVVPIFSDGLFEAPETLTVTILPTATYAPSVFDEVTTSIISKNK